MSREFEQLVNELVAEGRKEGKAEGKIEGKIEGKKEAQKEIILSMLQKGIFSIKQIADIVSTDEASIADIAKESGITFK